MKPSIHAGLRPFLRAGYGGYVFPEPMQDFGFPTDLTAETYDPLSNDGIVTEELF